MKNTNTIFTLLFLTIFCTGLFSFNTANSDNETQIGQITVLESIVPGGLGQSKMIVTLAGEKSTTIPLKNYYSLAGTNFENIASNQEVVNQKLNELIAQDWKIENVNSSIISIADDKNTNGFHCTKYLLKRKIKKEK